MAKEKRLIDVTDDNIKAILEKVPYYPDEIWKFTAMTKRFPTVDAVEVVRCCDCKYGIWDDEEAMWKCVYSAEFDECISEWLGFCDYNDGNHFCSYGERKE